MATVGDDAQSVSQRTREIPTRMAVGVTQADISSMVLWEGGRLFLLGILIGVPVSFATSGVIRTLMFNVSPDELMTRIVVIVALTSTVALALLIPLWRATRVNPQIALRDS